MHDHYFTEEEFMTMKIGITREFAYAYGLTIPEVIDLFEQHSIYQLLDRGGAMFITKSYEYMVEKVADYIGIPSPY